LPSGPTSETGGLGCWLAEQVKAAQKDGGVITSQGEWLYLGNWHTYLVALLGFREQNWFNLVDLYRCSAPAGTRKKRQQQQPNSFRGDTSNEVRKGTFLKSFDTDKISLDNTDILSYLQAV
jgi:hypothetical protein